MQLRPFIVFATACLVPGLAAKKPNLDAQFEETVRPFVTKYCVGCHSGKSPAAQFDLKSYTNLSAVTAEYPRWSLVRERLEAKTMPPKPVPAPPAAETQRIVDWIQAVRTEEIKKFAGDPGLV